MARTANVSPQKFMVASRGDAVAYRKEEKEKFRFEAIASFDARQQCRRCSVPSTAVGHLGRIATADIWWQRGTHRGERLVVRLSCGGYSYHYACFSRPSRRIPETELPLFVDCLEGVLNTWLCDGPDDWPM